MFLLTIDGDTQCIDGDTQCLRNSEPRRMRLRPPSILGPKRYLLARNTTSSSTTVHDDDEGRRKRARFLDGIVCQGLIGPVGPLNVEESPLPSRIH